MATAHADPDRWTRPVAIMETIPGRDGAQAVRDGFEQMFPASGRHAVEAGLADVDDRPGLDLRSRQLAAHVRGALDVGVTAEELLEAVFQLALHVGHARAGNALRTALEVCRERGIEPKRVEGSVTHPTTQGDHA